MITAKLAVSALVLHERLQHFQTRRNQLQGFLNNLRSFVQRIRDAWEGEAGDAYYQECQRCIGEVEESLQVVDDYIHQVNITINVFAETDSNVRVRIQTDQAQVNIFQV